MIVVARSGERVVRGTHGGPPRSSRRDRQGRCFREAQGCDGLLAIQYNRVAVRMSSLLSAIAGVAKHISSGPSAFVRSISNVGPALSTDVTPSSLIQNNMPL